MLTLVVKVWTASTGTRCHLDSSSRQTRRPRRMLPRTRSSRWKTSLRPRSARWSPCHGVAHPVCHTLQRHKLKQPLTPVTPENFAIWKKTRVDKKVAEQEAKEKAKAAQRAAGKISGMSGKDLFDYSADLFEDDAVSRLLNRLVLCLTTASRRTRTTRTTGICNVTWPRARMPSGRTKTMRSQATTTTTRMQRARRLPWRDLIRR